jgi:hypothetical protein
MLLENCEDWIYDFVCWLFRCEEKAHAAEWLYKEGSNPSFIVKPYALFYIPLWVLPLIIKAQRWFVLVELYWIKAVI